jgi:hypothetical protein
MYDTLSARRPARCASDTFSESTTTIGSPPMSELLLVRIDGRRMPNVFPQNYCFFPPNLASVAVGNLMRLRRHRPNFTPLAGLHSSQHDESETR